MRRHQKSKVVRSTHYTWRLRQRGKTWYADGRASNDKGLGRYSLGTSDFEDALSALTQLDAHVGSQNKAEPPNAGIDFREMPLPIEAGLRLYRDHLARPISAGGTAASTKRRYESVLKKFSTFCGKQRIELWSHVDAAVFNGYAASLTERTLSAKTIYFELSTLRSVLRYLIEIKRLPSEAQFRYRLRRPREKRRYAFTAAEFSAMVESCDRAPGLRWLGDVVFALGHTGMRVGELVQLDWDAVDLERMIIQVRHIEDRAADDFTPTTKTKKSRSFPIHPELALRLRSFRHRTGPVFVGPTGNRLTTNQIRRYFGQVLRPALIDRFGVDRAADFARAVVHSLRHSFISTCVTAGVPEAVIMDWVGQSDSQIVRHYFHLKQDASARMMNGLSFSAGDGSNGAVAPANNNGESPATDGAGDRAQIDVKMAQ